jgi:hypothetical protein
MESIHSSLGGSSPGIERNMLVVVKSFFKSLIESSMTEKHMCIHIEYILYGGTWF